LNAIRRPAHVRSEAAGRRSCLNDSDWPVTASCKRHAPPKSRKVAIGSTRPSIDSPSRFHRYWWDWQLAASEGDGPVIATAHRRTNRPCKAPCFEGDTDARGTSETGEQKLKMFDSSAMTLELSLGIAQTEHGEGRHTGFVACTKQNYDVVGFHVGKWLTHVIHYFLRIIDQDSKHALALTGCNVAQVDCLKRRAQMDENPLTVHDGNDFSCVNATTPFAFDAHILSVLYFFVFLERNGKYRIQEASA
jgi:hypothetical protein